MAEAKKTDSKNEPKAADLSGLGESSDPEVQRLLAERQTAVMNDDEDAIAKVDAQLADHR